MWKLDYSQLMETTPACPLEDLRKYCSIDEANYLIFNKIKKV